MLFWYLMYYFLGASAILLSVTVASKPFTDPFENDYRTIAWLLALVTSLITFLNPEERGNRYQRAFRVLSVAITRYLASQDQSVDHVLEAYEHGEDIIHQTSETELPPKPSPES